MSNLVDGLLALETLLKSKFSEVKFRKGYPDFNQEELSENTLSLLYRGDGLAPGVRRVGESVTRLDIEVNFYAVDEIALFENAQTIKELRSNPPTVIISNHKIQVQFSATERVEPEPDNPAILNHSFFCTASLLMPNRG